jgi:hypothetical protein
MQMRHSPRPLVALLGAALSFLPGCESTKSSGPSPTDAQTGQPATVSTGTTSWKNARVGDRVTYSFSANQGAGPGGGTARALSGLAVLEVVAVQQPWVWVRMSFADAAGKPLAQVKLAKDLIIPVRADTTRPIDVPHRGQATADKPSTAGLTWEAMRYVEDSRAADGPLQTRVYANEPGPLYLTHGLLDASTELSGFGTPGSFQLTLREFHEGEAGAKATPPSLERPLGPGAYYDRRVEVGPSPSVQRVCFGAERGFILRTESPVDTSAAPCSDFSQAEPQPLEEVLMGLPWEALASDWPPATAASAAPGKFTVESHDVPALTAQRTENVEGTQRVFSETWAADPWAPALAGLPYEARFQPLSSGTERVAAGGKREPEGGTRLVRWGSWVEGSQK